jgi:hypothetical protein
MTNPVFPMIPLAPAGGRRLAALVLALPLALMPALVVPGGLRADEPPVAMAEGLALSGHDVVAYFKQGRAIEGRPEHALKWRGAVWRFASAETQMAFEMNPRAYAPRFGGYCALALSAGRLAPSDPGVFAIHEGRLYLAASPSALARWQADPTTHIAAARAEWPTVLGR